MTTQQITQDMINDKAEELLANRVVDDSYFGDALCDSFAEARALFKAKSIDDKLAAVDAFQAQISKILETGIETSAYSALIKQIARG
ncbi:MAG: hypothetical protein V4440_14705 [Pseudomonadota bacterium]